jgi:integrase
MPSFRTSRARARHLVESVCAIGVAKTDAVGLICSLGSKRIYTQSIAELGDWMRSRGLGSDIRRINEDGALRWLNARSEYLGQKALDNDRLAIKKALGFCFPRIPSNFDAERRLAQETRAYTICQVDSIVLHQSKRNAFSTRVAQNGGLRAHELHTLRLATENPAMSEREWSPDRFTCMTTGTRYTVVGKGGLVREVLLPQELARQLESFRRERPITIRDREINYLAYYDIAGGNAWSKSFSEASVRALGYSRGGHGLRHGYAQSRVEQLQRGDFTYADALRIVSQELGHFRPDITEIYLR